MKRADYAILSFVMDYGIAAVGLLVNLRGQDLHATTLQLGLIGAAWGLPYALVSIPAGQASSRFDRRITLSIGFLLFALYCALCGLATSPIHLIAVGGIGGLANGFFWPIFETLLHAGTARETRSNLGVFNISWTLGVMSGAACAGFLYHAIGPRAVFEVIAAGVALAWLYFLWRSRRGIAPYIPSADEEDADSRDAERVPLPLARRVGYLRMAWVANFSLWFGGPVAATIFPKLGRHLHFQDGAIGVIMAAVWAGQIAVFYVVSSTHRWHYRFAPMFAMQVVGIVALSTIAGSSVALLFAFAFLLMGLSRGLAYTASLYYGLDAGGHGTANTGLHEAVIGGAYVLGPFVSGIVGAGFGLRAPFILAAALEFLSLVTMTILWLRLAPVAAEAVVRRPSEIT